MKTLKIWRYSQFCECHKNSFANLRTKSIDAIILTIFATLSISSCGSSDPEWADLEAHEKTEQLREQYTPFIIGTWHYEETFEKQRVFEQLTFNANGTFKGQRKWQSRQLVNINGEEKYTDWQDISVVNGTFTGTWSLRWDRIDNIGRNCLNLYAQWDDTNNTFLAYSSNALFGYADATTLQFASYWQNSDGWTIYERGEAEPSF